MVRGRYVTRVLSVLASMPFLTVAELAEAAGQHDSTVRGHTLSTAGGRTRRGDHTLASPEGERAALVPDSGRNRRTRTASEAW